ncbi:hypothetical protein PTTG_30137 [Puccinia triticina 1-1 BBBD Race 1]|uniref:Uncharacterized protein n=1 Tax=Puccinia triticina (isolate 1-1 / race 1 (BBBD)) TaxID=630390 RepID=A0A180G0N8_PUCT1|nr:hypothetical protein PTTG_30137 [Puccinia triticina 1-1 BBBD Race 1]
MFGSDRRYRMELPRRRGSPVTHIQPPAALDRTRFNSPPRTSVGVLDSSCPWNQPLRSSTAADLNESFEQALLISSIRGRIVGIEVVMNAQPLFASFGNTTSFCHPKSWKPSTICSHHLFIVPASKNLFALFFPKMISPSRRSPYPYRLRPWASSAAVPSQRLH